ncbi:uncharacterized protein LOC144567512 isoform X2 [Carex rostrata]
MSASSDDVFYSARDSSSSNSNLSQNQHHPLSPTLNTNLDPCADLNHHLMPPPDKWLLRIASSAGQIISSVLGLSDGSSGDDESDEEVAETPIFYEEKYESGERIKKLNQGTEFEADKSSTITGRRILFSLHSSQGCLQSQPSSADTIISSSDVTGDSQCYSFGGKEMV